MRAFGFESQKRHTAPRKWSRAHAADIEECANCPRALPDSRLLLVQDAGHMNWVDQPEFVTAWIDEFLRGKWPSEARSLSTHPQ